MKKYFYNFYLIIKNIKNYGIITFFYASIIELYYLMKFLDFTSYIHDSTSTSTYEETKTQLKYNTQHTPTPYFFLSIALDFIKREKYSDFVLIDMGCGYGRVGKYFLSKLEILFYGLEINEKIINSISFSNKFKEKSKIFQLDLRNKEKREKIFNEIKSLNKNIVIFFSDPFDIDTIVDILKTFEDDEHIIVGVNVNNLEKLLVNYKIKYIKNFENKLRHVVLLKKNE